jgi:hypothetical protein
MGLIRLLRLLHFQALLSLPLQPEIEFLVSLDYVRSAASQCSVRKYHKASAKMLHTVFQMIAIPESEMSKRTCCKDMGY